LGFFDDVGNFATQVVQNTVQAGGQLINSVTGAVGDTLQGGGINAISEKASKRFNQGFGAYGTLAGGSFLQTDAIKQAGRDQATNNLTLGLAGDASGLGNFLQTSRSTGAYSQDDLNSALRASGKAIAIGGAAGLYNPNGASLGQIGSITSGSSGSAAAWSVTDLSAGTILGGYAVGKSIADRGAGTVVQNLLSDATGGAIPRVPNPISSPPLGGRIGSSAPSVTSPWQFADSGISGSGSGGIPERLMLAGVAVLAAYAYVRLSK
jgi:hypothetical protein